MLNEKEQKFMRGKGYTLQEMDRIDATRNAFARGEYSKSGVHLSPEEIKKGKGVKRNFSLDK